MMKKITGIFLGLMLLGLSVSAQKLYVRAHAGYGISATPESNPVRNSIETKQLGFGDSISKTSETINITSAGGGMQVGGAIGYRITSHFGVELGAHYLQGSPVTAQREVIISTSAAPGQPDPQGQVHIDISRQTRQLRLTPSVFVEGGDITNLIVPYARFGLLIPVGGKTTTHVHQHYKIPQELEELTTILGSPLRNDSTITTDYATKGKLSFGIQSAVGVTVNVWKLGIFAELAHQSLAVKADYTEMVSYKQNGKDRMDTQLEYDKRINYVDELNGTSNNMTYNPAAFKNNTGDYDPSAPGYQKPKDDLRAVSQFSNIGLNLGVKFRF